MPPPNRRQYTYNIAPVGKAIRSSNGDTSYVSAALLITAGLLIPGVIAYGLGVANEGQVLAVILGVVALGVILARPFWGLALFVGLLYVRPEDSFPVLAGMRLTLIISLITLIGLMVQLCMDRKAPVRSPITLMLVGFLGAITASSLVNDGDLTPTLDMAKVLIIVMLVVNLIKTPKQYVTFTNVIIVFTTYVALYSVSLYYNGGALAREGFVQAQGKGLFNDPNDLAATIVAGLAFVLIRLFSVSGIRRYVYIAIAASLLWGLLLTNSRGGMLSVIVLILVFAFNYCKNKRMAGLLALAAVATLFVLGSSGRMTDFDSKETSAAGRLNFWQNGIDTLKQRPLLGCGYGKFPKLNDGYVAHNTFVHCFAELGLVGYFFWMGSLYYAFRKRPSVPQTDSENVPPSRELLGARIMLVAHLTSCFFLSRAYNPITFLMISMPVVAQLVFLPAPSDNAVLSEPPKRWREFVKIGTLTIASIVFIQLFITLQTH